MCIACELGYWSMVDALEAERNALREQEKGDAGSGGVLRANLAPNRPCARSRRKPRMSLRRD